MAYSGLTLVRNSSDDETLSGNAEGYKVFCIQLDKSRFVEMEYTTDRRFSEDAL